MPKYSGQKKSQYNYTFNKIKKYIIARDKKCLNCGSEEKLEVHHKIPRSLGGFNSPGNLITLCKICHKKETISFNKSYLGRDLFTTVERKLKKRGYRKDDIYFILMDHFTPILK